MATIGIQNPIGFLGENINFKKKTPITPTQTKPTTEIAGEFSVEGIDNPALQPDKTETPKITTTQLEGTATNQPLTLPPKLPDTTASSLIETVSAESDATKAKNDYIRGLQEQKQKELGGMSELMKAIGGEEAKFQQYADELGA